MERRPWDVERTGGTVTVDADWSESSPALAVVEAVASLEEVDPVTLSTSEEFRLRDWISPEALDRIVAAGSDASLVQFDLREYTVRVADDRIEVE